MFSEVDIQQIEKRGTNIDTVQTQIQNFKEGFPFMDIAKAATVGEGIIRTDETANQKYIQKYEEALKQISVVKFVPASGAASRMFKTLFSFMDSYVDSEEAYEKMKEDQSRNSIYTFFKKIEDFAFYEDLKEVTQIDSETLETSILKRKYPEVLRSLLTEVGLDYGNLPKGLLQFHKYADASRTPVEEHLVEGANYSQSEGKVKLHLTVSPNHEAKFKEKIEAVSAKYEKAFNVQFEVGFSQQKPSTDTVAVDLENQPFREEDGTILFRPGGHGALIENLNDIDADIIFIKNIDNVVPDRIKETTYTYKKTIAGVLIDYQNRIFEFLSELDKGNTITDETLLAIEQFLEKELCTLPTENLASKTKAEKISYFQSKLNRPIRVCGMVKNEGEPGGGPFWVKNSDGSTSLQIVESAQIDMKDQDKNDIVQNATHFNPVDLVCAVKNYKGEKFDLLQFRDPQTGFITQKSKSGRDLKAQELPGLWNGAMAFWNTIFVEVPIITFNPVKTVNDLLREEHQ